MQKWFDDNQALVQEFTSYTGKQREGDTDIEYPSRQLNTTSFNKAVSDSIAFFNLLSRATEGLSSDEAVQLKSKIPKLMAKLQAAAFMSGRFYDDTLMTILSLGIPLTGKLKREGNTQDLNNGAVQSYRLASFGTILIERLLHFLSRHMFQGMTTLRSL